MDAATLPGGQKQNLVDWPEYQLVGRPDQENKDKAQRANPIIYMTKASPPFLILDGEHDPPVPANQSELLFEALRKAGNDMTFFKIVGVGHGGPRLNTPVVYAMVLLFLDRHLKPPASTGTSKRGITQLIEIIDIRIGELRQGDLRLRSLFQSEGSFPSRGVPEIRPRPTPPSTRHARGPALKTGSSWQDIRSLFPG